MQPVEPHPRATADVQDIATLGQVHIERHSHFSPPLTRQTYQVMADITVLEEQLASSVSVHGSSVNEQSIELKVRFLVRNIGLRSEWS